MRRLAWSLLTHITAAVALVWPLPAHLTSGTSTRRLAPSWRVHLSECHARNAPTDLLQAIEELEVWIDVGRGELRRDAVERAPALMALHLHVDAPCAQPLSSIAEDAVGPIEQRPALERYALDVPEDGDAMVRAGTSLGLLRGMQSFAQLVYTLPSNSSSDRPHHTYDHDILAAQHVFALPAAVIRFIDNVPIAIEDAPAFGWRGFLLDTSRNFYDVDAILGLLRTMSMVKFSVFSWHVTDSHAWPLEVRSLPELARRGAYSARQTYSAADVERVIAFANARGIDVVMEIDTPGHLTSLAESHPDLVACREAQPWTKYANEPPAGQLRIAEKGAFELVKSVFDDVLPRLSSAYFSTGGDEVNTACYEDDEPTQHVLAASGQTLKQLLASFVSRTHDLVRTHRKTPVVWQEMVSLVELGKDAIVLPWRPGNAAQDVLTKGLRIVHARADRFYLDCGLGGWLGRAPHLDSWCDPLNSWQRMLSFDPFANVTEERRHLVLGGMTSLWSEQTDAGSIESVVWPRAAALSELFWHGYGSDLGDALKRLHAVRYRMVQRGIRAAPLQPEWCALRPGACDLPCDETEWSPQV